MREQPLQESGFPKGRRPPECPGTCSCTEVCGWAIIQGRIQQNGTPVMHGSCQQHGCQWPQGLGALIVEHKRYRQALVDLLETAEDMRGYVPEYFAQKWKHDDGLAAAREVLSA